MRRRGWWWLGCSAALGLVLAAAVMATGRGRGAESRSSAVRGSGPRSSLAVFSRRRRPEDAVPAAYVERAASLSGENASVPEQFRNGRIELEKSRLLLSNAGTTHVDLYAFPAGRGLVCSLWVQKAAGAGGGCGGFTPEAPVGTTRFDADGFGHGIPLWIGGLVPDDVTRIDVVVQGRAHEATLRNNAYFFEAPSPTLQPETIRVAFRGGKTATISLRRIPTG